MDEPTFLSVDDALTHHATALARHGGNEGLPSPNAIESAVFAAQHVYAYLCVHLDDRAGFALLGATYWYHVAKDHAFADGNKRTGLACCLDFLNRNGLDLQVSNDDELIDMGLRVGAGSIPREELANFIAERLVPLE